MTEQRNHREELVEQEICFDSDGVLYGKPGDSEEVGQNSIGWSGSVAHLNAPVGGGGPGSFRSPGPIINSDTVAAQNSASGARLPLQPLAQSNPTPANAPPKTKPRSFGSQKSVQSEFMDVAITAEIVADSTTSNRKVFAHTSFDLPRYRIPGYRTDHLDNIAEFGGKFVWKGTIVIQTIYGPGAKPKVLSGYGRGTTRIDIQNRDITLGFHENCHQVDFENYLEAHSLPEPPKMKIGMTKKDFEAEKKRFVKEYTAYRNAMNNDSETLTDEVGYKKSTWKSTKKPYTHKVP